MLKPSQSLGFVFLTLLMLASDSHASGQSWELDCDRANLAADESPYRVQVYVDRNTFQIREDGRIMKSILKMDHSDITVTMGHNDDRLQTKIYADLGSCSQNQSTSLERVIETSEDPYGFNANQLVSKQIYNCHCQ